MASGSAAPASLDDRAREEIGAFFRQGAWFAGLSTAVQDAILRLGHLCAFPAGHVVQFEDEAGAGLVGIVHGSVQFLRYVSADDTALIHVGAPGMWFGHMAVIDDGRTMATAVARTPVRALVLTRAAFVELAASDPQFGAAVTHVVLERSRMMFRYQAEARVFSAAARLAGRLADIADMRRLEVRTTGSDVTLDLSQSELAELVGWSRPQVNVRLRALQLDGLVTLGRRQITVRSTTGLRALVTEPRG